MKKIVFFTTVVLFLSQGFSQKLIPYREGSIWGYCNNEKKIIISLKYEYCEPFKYGYAKVKYDNDYGVIDTLGNEIIPCAFYDINIISDKAVLVQEPGKSSLRNMKNEIIHPCCDITYKEGLIKISTYENNILMYGFMDAEGHEVIPCTLQSASYFSDGLAAVQISQRYGNYGYIDKTGKLVIPEIFSTAKDFNNGYASVKLNFHNAIIDKTGKTITCPVNFDSVETFSEGLFIIKNSNSTYSAINEKGELIIPSGTYGYISEFKNGLAIYSRKNEKNSTYYGLINPKGVEITPPVYNLIWWDDKSGNYLTLTNTVGTIINSQGIEVFKGNYVSTGFINGLALVKINDYYTYVNEKGIAFYKDNYAIVYKIIEDYVTVFNEGRAFVGESQGNYMAKCQMIDTNLKYVKMGIFFYGGTISDGLMFYNGIARVSCNKSVYSKIGFIDKEGNYIVSCDYAPMSPSYFYENNYAPVALELQGKFGLINSKGELVVPLKYDRIQIYKNVIAVYFEDINKWGLINDKDSMIVKPTFNYIDVYTEYQDYMPAKSSETMKWGYVNRKGVWVIKPIYDYAYSFSKNGKAVVEIGKKFGLINKTGAYIYPCQYDKLRDFANGLIYLEKNGKYAIVDAKGVYLRNYKDSATFDFVGLSNKLIYDGKSKVYNEKMVVAFIMPDNFTPGNEKYTNGYLKIKAVKPDKNDKYPVAVIDTKGNFIINPYEFDDIKLNSEKYLPVRKGKKWGYIKILN